MKIRANIMVLVVVGVLVTGVAMAQFAKPEDAIKYRKSVMSKGDIHTWRKIQESISLV